MQNKRTSVVIAILLFLTPLFALAARKDAERTPLPPDTQSYTIELEASESESVSALSSTICEPAVDAGDEQLQESEVPKAAAPV